MTNQSWKVFARESISQADLTAQFAEWFPRKPRGLYLFREGPTVCDLWWADDSAKFSSESLEAIWIIRMFCEDFELYSRRLTFDDGGLWQLRIASWYGDLHEGEAIDLVGTSNLMLLGKNHKPTAGDANNFQLEPNRYRRAKINYPGDWKHEDNCRLVARQFQPTSGGGSISCWSHLVRDKEAELFTSPSS